MFRRQAPNLPSPQVACVIGAGISGSSTARALAELGWQVTVIDSGHVGASSLPLGLISPHTSKDDGALSQLSRIGMERMHVAMRTYLIEDLDWSLSGVMTYPRTGPVSDADTTWHPDAAWIKPASLTRALLEHPNIQVVRDKVVDALHLESNTNSWQVMSSGISLAHAEHVVLAAGPGCTDLCSGVMRQYANVATPPFDAIRGQVSWGLMAQTPNAPLPPNPINGRGSFVPHVPTPEGEAWFLGSTYDRFHPHVGVTEEDHSFNLTRLAELFPDTAKALEPVFSNDVRGWVGVRCTLHDRLPLVGSVADAPAGLWINSAMGSRGLTLGLLCSEILVAQMTGQPMPVDANLVRAISSHRFAEKARAKMLRK
jgi:tRNA 5-methylaminomethyl-2-thiouridine biosynthesis bifunctional protein